MLLRTKNLHIALLVLYTAQLVGVAIAIGLSATGYRTRLTWDNETFVVFDTEWNSAYLLFPYMGIPLLFHVGSLAFHKNGYIAVGDDTSPEDSWSHLTRWLEIGFTHVFILVFVAQASGNSDMWNQLHVAGHTMTVHIVGYLSEYERRPRIYLSAAIPALVILMYIGLSVFYDKTAQELWVIVLLIFGQASVSTILHALQIWDVIGYSTMEKLLLVINFLVRTVIVWEGFNYARLH